MKWTARLEEKKNFFESYLAQYLEDQLSLDLGLQPSLVRLAEASSYSLMNGGKRFRPLICLSLAEAFGVHPQRVLPWALAVELIHTYSLVHDDLPAMDNEDRRRGLPTSHKKYGESTAILVGDLLLTEAFRILAEAYSSEPALSVQLISILARRSGSQGMIAGQALDLSIQEGRTNPEQLHAEYLLQMHGQKTGALISAAALGTAFLCGLTESKRSLVDSYARNLGLAFQIADDILDSQDGKIEKHSFPGVLGKEQTRAYLEKVSAQAKQDLISLGCSESVHAELFSFVKINFSRGY
jgi:geranylgeranyl diphosphate synthase type II